MSQNFWIIALPRLTHFTKEEEGDAVLQKANKLDVWVTRSAVLSSQQLPMTPFCMRSSSLRHHFFIHILDMCICHSAGSTKENIFLASIGSISSRFFSSSLLQRTGVPYLRRSVLHCFVFKGCLKHSC